MISDGLEITSEFAIESGGFADVFKGTYKGTSVAVKVVKSCRADRLVKMRRVSFLASCAPSVMIDRPQLFYKEAVIWRRLSHENVLSFLGAASPTLYPLALVSVWMENGDIITYVLAHPEANRLSLVSLTG